MAIRPTSATLALSAALGCTLNISGESATEPKPETTDSGTDSGTSETPTGDTTIEPPPTGEPDTGTSEPSTSEPTTTTGETDTGVVEPMWCNGFDPQTGALTVHNNANEVIVDGTALAAECGGQGTLMIPIYPRFGGFEPASDTVTFDVVLDVEGFNLGPGGHFFEAVGVSHTIDCSQEEEEDTYYYGGYSYSFIPMFPPDAIPDINAVDGKPGHLKLTLHTPEGDVPFEADVVMAADIEQCGYGGG